MPEALIVDDSKVMREMEIACLRGIEGVTAVTVEETPS